MTIDKAVESLSRLVTYEADSGPAGNEYREAIKTLTEWADYFRQLSDLVDKHEKEERPPPVGSAAWHHMIQTDVDLLVSYGIRMTPLDIELHLKKMIRRFY